MQPQIFGVIERPTLLSRLQAAQGRRVIVVSAPAGYGKTTLVVQHIQSLEQPVLWQSIQPADRDVTNLYHHALSHLKAVAPDIDALAPSAFDNNPAALAYYITGYLSDHLSSDSFIYVIDDWHVASATSTDDWLLALADSFPAGSQLIIISRTVPKINYLKLITQDAIAQIKQSNLRMDQAEIVALAEQYGRNVNAIRPLVERLDGWPAGISLVLKPESATLPDQQLDVSVDPEAAFNLLSVEMFNALDSRLQAFLLASSTLSFVTPNLCRDSLGLEAAAQRLSEVRKQNLFVVETASGLKYHDLFRAYLQTRFQSEDPEQFQILHQRAGGWFEAHGELDPAFDHYLLAGNPQSAADLAQGASPLYFSQGKFHTLLDWDQRLEELGTPAPHLTYECALYHFRRYDYEEASRSIMRADRTFRIQGDTVGLALVQILRGWIDCQSGAFEQALTQAQDLLTFDDEEVRGRAHRLAGQACLRLMRLDDSIRYLKIAEQIYRHLDLRAGLSQLLLDLGHAYMHAGRLADTGRCLQEVVALCRKMGDGSPLALALNNLGYHYYQQNDYAQALSKLREGLSVAARIHDIRDQIFLLWSLADLERDLGWQASGLDHYYEALSLLVRNPEPELKVSVLNSLSVFHRRQGDDDLARTYATDALNDSQEGGLERLKARAALALAEVRLQPTQSILHDLQPILDALKNLGVHYERSGLLATCALVCWLDSNQALARTYLQDALEEANFLQTGQAVAAEVIDYPEMRDLLARLPHNEVVVEALVKLEEAIQSLADQEPGEPLQETIYNLTLYTLGKIEIERNGQLLIPSDWQTSISRDLFFLILLKGPMTREQLSLYFWPEGDVQGIRDKFHTELRRARQLIGKHTILHQNGLYCINPELSITRDDLAFEKTITQARSLPDSKARAQDYWQVALDLYQGTFLPAIGASWVVAQREAYQEMYLEALDHMARLALVINDAQRALDLWQKSLDVDPLQEEIYRAIMTMYAEQGERAKVIHTYDQLCHHLQVELDVEPSPETHELYQTLTRR